jgi:hypothetical protein
VPGIDTASIATSVVASSSAQLIVGLMPRASSSSIEPRRLRTSGCVRAAARSRPRDDPISEP